MKSIRVAFIERASVARFYKKFVGVEFIDIFNRTFPNAAADLFHGRAFRLPAVKIADNAYLPRIGSPNAEASSSALSGMCAEIFVCLGICPFMKQIKGDIIFFSFHKIKPSAGYLKSLYQLSPLFSSIYHNIYCQIIFTNI